jgi:hypothetical protein
MNIQINQVTPDLKKTPVVILKTDIIGNPDRFQILQVEDKIAVADGFAGLSNFQILDVTMHEIVAKVQAAHVQQFGSLDNNGTGFEVVLLDPAGTQPGTVIVTTKGIPATTTTTAAPTTTTTSHA